MTNLFNGLCVLITDHTDKQDHITLLNVTDRFITPWYYDLSDLLDASEYESVDTDKELNEVKRDPDYHLHYFIDGTPVTEIQAMELHPEYYI